jgi:hypothetical protein
MEFLGKRKNQAWKRFRAQIICKSITYIYGYIFDILKQADELLKNISLVEIQRL